MNIDNQEIILGNCLKVLDTFDDKTFDTIITSPPYNLDINYNSYKDKLKLEEYLKFIESVFLKCKRVLTDDGSIFLNIGSTNTQPYIPYHIILKLSDIFVLQNDIIWIKSISIHEESFGHYKPINSDRYLNHMFEHVFHLTKTGDVKINRKSIGVPYKYKCNLNAVTVTEDIRCRGNTWFIPYETIHSKNQRGDHPAIFPIQLAEWCIKLHGSKYILDPFLGSGTTLIASKNLKCEGVGIEIDEKYYQYTVDKIVTFI